MSLTANQWLEINKLQNEAYNSFIPNENNKTEDIVSFKVDGKTITCYASYSYFDAKSYVKQPIRSSNGVIDNLNSYATFLTPRLRIKFNMMPLETYRTIMKLIQSKNEFVVECYDIVWDKIKSWKAYFSTEDYPELFTYDLHTLGVINYEIELQGTNSDLDLISIVYHKNDGSGKTVADDDIYQNQAVIIGKNAEELKTREGYQFQGWVTDPLKVEESDYIDNTEYTITENLVLYARWVATSTRTLSYDYGLGKTYIQSDGTPLYSKSIKENDKIGVLPNTIQKPVIYNNQLYHNAYTLKGWYWTPQINATSTKISETTIFNVKGNATIYQIFEPNLFTITFHSAGGSLVYPITQVYGSNIYAPNTPTKSGFTFGGWYTNANFTGNPFSFTTMPPTNITLYAKWV